MHYHLVEQNPFLNIVKSHLKNSKVLMVSSMSADINKFNDNFKWINELDELIESISLVQDPDRTKKLCKLHY